MSGDGDQNQSHRKLLTLIGGAIALAGVICLIRGIYLFTTPIRIPAQEFINDPGRAIDAHKGSARRGMGLFVTGGIMAMLGFALVTAATRGRFGRFGDTDTMPLSADPAEDVAEILNAAVRVAREKVREEQKAASGPGIQHTCGAWNDISDRFCKGCGQALVRLHCPKCGAQNDADAKFCDKCGMRIART